MGWNGSSEKLDTDQRSVAARKCAKASMPVTGRNAKRIIVLGVLVVSLGVLIFWWYAVKDAQPVSSAQVAENKKPTAIASVTPNLAKPTPIPAKNYAELSNRDLQKLSKDETNHLNRAQLAYWKIYHPWPPPDKDQPKAAKGPYHIFDNKADNEIAMVLSVEPGTMIFGNRKIGPGFERRFLKSITNPIITTESDTDYEKSLKKAVVQAKIELKAALDRGEDIGKIMDDSFNEVRELGRYKRQLEKEAAKIIRPSDDAKSIEDTITAVNKMLENKGIAPIQLNSLSRLAIKYQAAKHQEKEIKE